MTRIESYCNLTDSERRVYNGIYERASRLSRNGAYTTGVRVITVEDAVNLILDEHAERAAHEVDRQNLFKAYVRDLYRNDLLSYARLRESLYTLVGFHMIDDNVLAVVNKVEAEEITRLMKEK